jgi:hypothetical protein
MSNVVMNLYKDKPKSCNSRHVPENVSRKLRALPDFEFTDESRKEFNATKKTYGIRVNGKWVYQPETPVKERKSPEIYKGQFKDSCRSEGNDG